MKNATTQLQQMCLKCRPIGWPKSAVNYGVCQSCQRTQSGNLFETQHRKFLFRRKTACYNNCTLWHNWYTNIHHDSQNTKQTYINGDKETVMYGNVRDLRLTDWAQFSFHRPHMIYLKHFSHVKMSTALILYVNTHSTSLWWTIKLAVIFRCILENRRYHTLYLHSLANGHVYTKISPSPNNDKLLCRLIITYDKGKVMEMCNTVSISHPPVPST